MRAHIAVLLAVALAVAGCVRSAPGGEHRPVTASPRPTANCPTDIGIAPAWILRASDAELNRDMVAARDAGATRFRFDVDWSLVEPARGQFDWAPIDRMVQAITGHGMRPLGVLAYTPEWARPAGAADRSGVPASHYAPAKPTDFAAFAKAAATRYPDVITDWEIWNEPNRSSFWSPAPDAGAYTKLLIAASEAIRTVQPGANIIAGALAPGENHAAGEIDPITFAQRIYDGGGRHAFDTMSIHPYTYPWMPTDPDTANWSTFQKIPRLHDLMASNGDRRKPIWITEFGAPTGSDSTSVSRVAQAEYLAAGVSAARKLGYVPVVLIYSIRDSGNDPADPEHNFGLMTEDFEPKPGYRAVQRLTGVLVC